MAINNIPDFDNQQDADLFIAQNAEELRIVFQDQALVNVRLGNRLIDRLAANGLTEQQIVDTLLMDFERDGQIFGGLKKQFRTSAKGFSNESGDEVFDFTYRTELRKKDIDPGERFQMWASVLAPGITCENCFEYHGEIRKANEWIGVGPRQRYSRCGFNCLCELQDIEVVADDLQADKISEVINEAVQDKRDFKKEVDNRTSPIIRENRAARRTDAGYKESKQYNRLASKVNQERAYLGLKGTAKDELEELMRKAGL